MKELSLHLCAEADTHHSSKSLQNSLVIYPIIRILDHTRVPTRIQALSLLTIAKKVKVFIATIADFAVAKIWLLMMTMHV